MTVEVPGKYIFQVRADVRLRHTAESGPRERLRVAFDNKGAGCLIKLVRVGGENSVIVFAKCKRQPMKELSGAIPNVLVWSYIEIGLELSGEPGPDNAVYAIAADKQVAVSLELFHIADLIMKMDLNSQRLAAASQDLEQPNARNTGKAVAVNRNLLVLVDYVNIVPCLKFAS